MKKDSRAFSINRSYKDQCIIFNHNAGASTNFDVFNIVGAIVGAAPMIRTQITQTYEIKPEFTAQTKLATAAPPARV